MVAGANMRKKKIYLTGDIVKILGITKTWLYALEREKKIPKARRDPISNYRYYTNDDLKQLKKIRRERGLK